MKIMAMKCVLLMAAVCIGTAASAGVEKEVTLTEAGMLKNVIGDASSVTNLKINGPLNGTDILYVRRLAGADSLPETSTSGQLTALDLSGATFEAGGSLYYGAFGTVDNVVSTGMFCETKLHSVVLPANVTEIGINAFSQSSIESITIPQSVTTIGKDAFAHCYALGSITIPATVTSIGEYCFIYCSGLDTVTIPDGATYAIEEGVFSNCSALERVVIGNGVTGIKKWAFSGDHSLKEVTIGRSVASIGDYAFYSCPAMTTITCLAPTPPELSEDAFSGITAANITLRVRSAHASKYRSADKWSDFTIEEIAQEGGETDMTVALTEAGTLADMVGDDNKMTVEWLSVSGPLNGTDILYLREMAGATAQRYETTSGKLTYLDLSKAQIVAGGSAYYSEETTADNVVGDVMFYGTGLKTVALPESATEIGMSVFNEVKTLESVTMGKSVTKIGSRAFSCTALTSISLPETLVSIDDYAFDRCSKLQNVYIYDNLTTLGTEAFSGCTSMEWVRLGSGVKSIGMMAFCGGTKIKSFTIRATTPPTMESDVFYKALATDATLYVPEGSKAAYTADTQWAAFSAVKEGLPTGIGEVSGEGAVEVERYDVWGRRLQEPSAGINIVRMSDGTIIKQLVEPN